MINLRIIDNIIFVFFTIILILIFNSKNSFSLENKILFKINGNAYTSLDYRKRIQYLDFIGTDDNLSDERILKDLISVSLFYEHYKKMGIKSKFDKEINEIYKTANNNNIKNNKKNKYQTNIEDIYFNIKIDLIRKNILEELLREKIENFQISNEEINLLYKYNIQYINFESEKIITLKRKINELEEVNIDSIIILLNEYNIEYFFKEKEINDLSKINKKLKNKILTNNKYFIFENNNKISIIFLEKNFETYNGIIANLFSIETKDELNNDDLKCKNIRNNNINNKIFSKEYKFTDLNNELKSKLININDFIKFTNDDKNLYVVLCEIKFNREILNNIKINKLINLQVSDIESIFINKYSKIYNLIELNV